jgi:hypothetical protein
LVGNRAGLGEKLAVFGVKTCNIGDKRTSVAVCCLLRRGANFLNQTWNRTLQITDKNAILYPNKQLSDNKKKREKLEDNPLWTRQQRKREHKNKHWIKR